MLNKKFKNSETERSALTWKRKTQQYDNGKIAYLKNTPVGSVDWDSGCPPEGKHYQVTNRLPGYKSIQGHYATEGEAKEKMELITKTWLEKTGLRIVE